MRLSDDECLHRMANARHGVLGTAHADRGVDAVPVVFALDGHTLFVPVDTVKAKSSSRLRRLANIDADPRCVLLVEHWAEDWSRLWWVRAHGTGRVVEDDAIGRWVEPLAARYDVYSLPGTITGGIEITITDLTGWAASEDA